MGQAQVAEPVNFNPAGGGSEKMQTTFSSPKKVSASAESRNVFGGSAKSVNFFLAAESIGQKTVHWISIIFSNQTRLKILGHSCEPEVR